MRMRTLLAVTVTCLSLSGLARAAEESAPGPATAAAPPGVARNLRVGQEGLFHVSALLNAWYLASRSNVTENTFRIRRAGIHFNGSIVPERLDYEVYVDPAKVLEFQSQSVAVKGVTTPASVIVQQPASAVSILKDMFLTYRTPAADWAVGQFKTPVSWEGFNSAAHLLLPERSLSSVYYGVKRDIGVRASKRGPTLGYWVELFNGNSENRLDNNNAKDAAVRLEIYPVHGLLVAGVAQGSWQEDGTASDRDRYEGDVRYEHGAWILQGEYLRGRDVRTVGTGHAYEKSQGGYVAAGWKPLGDLQIVGRAGYLDTDETSALVPSGTPRTLARNYEGGLNYFLDGDHAKLQLSYSHFVYDRRPNADQVLLNTQVAF